DRRHGPAGVLRGAGPRAGRARPWPGVAGLGGGAEGLPGVGGAPGLRRGRTRPGQGGALGVLPVPGPGGGGDRRARAAGRALGGIAGGAARWEVFARDTRAGYFRTLAFALGPRQLAGLCEFARRAAPLAGTDPAAVVELFAG